MNVEAWVKSLSKQKLKEFTEVLDGQSKTGNIAGQGLLLLTSASLTSGTT